MLRVVKAPSSSSAPYAASSRPVPPQPAATTTGEARRSPASSVMTAARSVIRSAQRTRSPRSTGPSAQARAVRATPSSPTTGTGQPRHNPVAQVSGCSRAVWLQAPWASAARATACSIGVDPAA